MSHLYPPVDWTKLLLSTAYTSEPNGATIEENVDGSGIVFSLPSGYNVNRPWLGPYILWEMQDRNGRIVSSDDLVVKVHMLRELSPPGLASNVVVTVGWIDRLDLASVSGWGSTLSYPTVQAERRFYSWRVLSANYTTGAIVTATSNTRRLTGSSGLRLGNMVGSAISQVLDDSGVSTVSTVSSVTNIGVIGQTPYWIMGVYTLGALASEQTLEVSGFGFAHKIESYLTII